MARKTDEERLQELEKKIEQTKARKMQVERRIKEKDRKARTRRLIQVGAIFEKYFDIEGEEEAEQVAFGMKEAVKKHKEKLLKIDVEKSLEKNEVVYKEPKEQLIVPEEKPDYQTNHS